MCIGGREKKFGSVVPVSFPPSALSSRGEYRCVMIASGINRRQIFSQHNSSEIRTCSISQLFFCVSTGLIYDCLQLDTRLVLKHVPIPSLSVFHINDSLVSVLHTSLLYPRFDTLFRGKFQHLFDLSRTSDTAPG